MHIYFSGIGGTGIGPLALVAQQAGYQVSGSDKQPSDYITYLESKGISQISIGQDYETIAGAHQKQPIDWFVYTSALPMENPNAPELQFCRDHGIKMSKRDEFLTKLLADKNQKLIAIAGTHGKTTTTAMTVWLLQQLGVPISYILPAKTSFADMGHFDPASRYFVYEADEFDRNFLAFNPWLSMITGIDWDHPDIYPTEEIYNQAFVQFLDQSEHTYIWQSDADRIGANASSKVTLLDYRDDLGLTLPGLVNRTDAALVHHAISAIPELSDAASHIETLNQFPGVSRRFEQIIPGLYSDYAHTVPKIQGALQLGHEVAGEALVVVYEGLHNTRQHFIAEDLKNLFSSVAELHIVPSYLAREDTSLELLTPEKLRNLMSPEIQAKTTASSLGPALEQAITTALDQKMTVLCLSAGGGGSLDEWLRRTFSS